MVDFIKHNNVIHADTVAEGKLKTTGVLQIQGHFTGEIMAEISATVSPTGRVIGELRAGHAMVDGSVEGLLEGNDNITLSHTANVDGVVSSPKLSVEPGASLLAYCAITPDKNKREQIKEKHSNRTNQSNVQTVSFSFPFPQAKDVKVVGDFCNWDEKKGLQCYPSNNGHWTAQIQLTPGKYEYLVVTDGTPQLDPTNQEKVSNSFGGQNSLITIS